MIGGLTYIWIADSDPSGSRPSGDSIWSFADFNEAMSYAKWIDFYAMNTGQGTVWVWNWNGGSGSWNNAVFTGFENKNYPTP
jgi:hypothetical protein